MGSKTKIEWTATVNSDGTVTPGSSWNPIRARTGHEDFEGVRVGWHCEKVSPGCANCYAERINRRVGTRERYGKGVAESFLDEKMLTAPLRWRKPRRVFVCSMSDLFGNWVPDEWLDRIFAVMALAPQHTFQVLTKRSARMREYMGRGKDSEAFKPIWEAAGRPKSLKWPPPNVWLGVSAEDQPRLDERGPDLLETPAAVRFVSAEPLLGSLDLNRKELVCKTWRRGFTIGRYLDWVIVGGESGPGARPMDIAWARDIVEQCREDRVACFVKQLGSVAAIELAAWRDLPWTPLLNHRRHVELEKRGLVRLWFRHPKGGDPEEWPEDLRVREFPEARG
jgi:protein gp37